jgi:glycolate oxidase FAD binding subunit
MEQAAAALAERVKQAAARGVRLRIVGHGSKDFYGGPLRGEPLATAPLAGVVEYEPAELVLSAGAATPLPELEAVLAQRDQMLAFEPPRFAGRGTLGGAIAAGLAGPRRAYAGAPRDFVLGVRLIDGRGRLLRFGGRVLKNVAGFDVSRLLVGSLGTLGVLTEITLKVLPRPAQELTLCFELSQAEALERMNRLAARALPLSASAWLDRRLYVRLSGPSAALRAARHELGGEELPDAAAWWDALRDQRLEFFARARWLWRVSLPPTAPPLETAACTAIEWGGALRWIADPADAHALRATAARHGGHATLFRAPQKPGGAFAPLPGALLELHRRIKAVFDPAGVFDAARLDPAL